MSNPDDDMLARWNHLRQHSLFPWLREAVDPTTEVLERLIIILDSIGLQAYVPAPAPAGRGRPPEDRRAIARGFVAKAVLGLPTTKALVERLAVDRSLRLICGWETRRSVPSEATFSRAFAEFAETALPSQMHEAVVARAFDDRIVGCLARDATEIEAREKPHKSDDPPPSAPAVPRKRGRPRKGEQRPKEPTRLERQATQSLSEMLADLPKACNVGTKRNSKGHQESWTGYKLHIDVANGQIPVAAVLTSASVHDSQVAIPLMTITGQRINYLYDLMDAGYDAAPVAEFSRAQGHVPIIDVNFRRDTNRKAECEAETKRLRLLNIPDPNDVLYDFRTMVERINARLKDEFGGRFLRVRGATKACCHLMFGLLALTVDQILRIEIRQPVPP